MGVTVDHGCEKRDPVELEGKVCSFHFMQVSGIRNGGFNLIQIVVSRFTKVKTGFNISMKNNYIKLITALLCSALLLHITLNL